MTLLESLSGVCQVELTSGDVAHFLDQAASKGLHLRDVSWINDLTIRFSVSPNTYKKLLLLAKRQGSDMRILSREGLYWQALTLLRRPVFLAGMILILLMGIFLPGKIPITVAVLVVQFLMNAKVVLSLMALKKGKWVKNITKTA